MDFGVDLNYEQYNLPCITNITLIPTYVTKNNSEEIRWLPMKFGGTSLAGADQWEIIATLLKDRLAAGYRPVLVCSAVAGVTDALKFFTDAPDAATRQTAIARILRPNHLLADALNLDISDLVRDTERALNRYLQDGIAADDFAAQAEVLALGELLSSRMGAAWLTGRGFSVSWQDSRQALVSRPEPERKRRQYLDARCTPRADPQLQQRWSAAEIIVAQGFLARNTAGQTVLLGRGGSDSSAAYIAAALGAEVVEIWSDVPGLFSTDPRMVPGARLLRQLDHNEALEIAAAGAAVIHPQCIRVAKSAGLELQLGMLGSDTFPGTVIGGHEDLAGSVVKAVSLRRNMVTLLLENQDMRQAVGFLARVFSLFADHGISLDQVATSETTTTVSLDLSSNHIDVSVVEKLAEQLKPHCQVRILAPSACISLVGRGIGKKLSGISQAMKMFETEQLWLASYSANDLAYTLVVPEQCAAELLKTLHAELIEQHAVNNGHPFGPDWQALQSGSAGYG